MEELHVDPESTEGKNLMQDIKEKDSKKDSKKDGDASGKMDEEKK